MDKIQRDDLNKKFKEFLVLNNVNVDFPLTEMLVLAALGDVTRDYMDAIYNGLRITQTVLDYKILEHNNLARDIKEWQAIVREMGAYEVVGAVQNG